MGRLIRSIRNLFAFKKKDDEPPEPNRKSTKKVSVELPDKEKRDQYQDNSKFQDVVKLPTYDSEDSVQHKDSAATDISRKTATERTANFEKSPSNWSWFRKSESQKKNSVGTVNGGARESRKVSFVSLFNATPFGLSMLAKRKESMKTSRAPSTETQKTDKTDRSSMQKPQIQMKPQNNTVVSQNNSHNPASPSTNPSNSKRTSTADQSSTRVASSVNQQKSSIIKPSNTSQRVAFLDSCGFHLERDIDSGAFANVYLAKTKTTKKVRSVAIKRVNIVAKQNKKFVNKFLGREVYIHSKLLHPCIIKFYEGLYSESDLYMVLEWVPRGNMLDYCRLKGRLNEATAARVMYQICSGLAYMHLNDTCHRDIKCENVLIMNTEPLNIKIADFGFAKMLGPKLMFNPAPGCDLQKLCEIDCKEDGMRYGSDGVWSAVSSNCNTNSKLKKKTVGARENSYLTSTFCGSLAYSAPELVMGKMYDGRKVDSWSAGCILFIMLTHRMAFREKNGNRALVSQQLAGVKWPQNCFDKISTEAKQLIEWILTFDHRERPFTDQILNHHWFAPYRTKFQDDIKLLAQEVSGISLEESGKERRARRKSMSESAINYH